MIATKNTMISPDQKTYDMSDMRIGLDTGVEVNDVMWISGSESGISKPVMTILILYKGEGFIVAIWLF